MTKSMFVELLSRRLGCDRRMAERLLGAFLDSVEDGLCLNRRVNLPGLGVLLVAENAPAVARNPGGAETDITPRRRPRFRPAASLKKALNS